MRQTLRTMASVAAFMLFAGNADAQDNTIPGLTQRAVAACESVVGSGGALSSHAGLAGFSPIPAVGSVQEALGRGIATGDDQFYVKVMRSPDACVVMVRDTVRRQAGPAIDAWSRASGITLERRPDGSGWGQRGLTEYYHTVVQGDINVLVVSRRR